MQLDPKRLGRKGGPVMILVVAGLLCLISLAFFGMAWAWPENSDLFLCIGLGGFGFATVLSAGGTLWLIWVQITRP